MAFIFVNVAAQTEQSPWVTLAPEDAGFSIFLPGKTVEKNDRETELHYAYFHDNVGPLRLTSQVTPITSRAPWNRVRVSRRTATASKKDCSANSSPAARLRSMAQWNRGHLRELVRGYQSRNVYDRETNVSDCHFCTQRRGPDEEGEPIFRVVQIYKRLILRKTSPWERNRSGREACPRLPECGGKPTFLTCSNSDWFQSYLTTPSKGLDAFAYRRFGMRPAR